MEDDFSKGEWHKAYLRLRSFPCAEGKEQQRSPPKHPPTAAGCNPGVVSTSLERAQGGLSGNKGKHKQWTLAS